MVAIWFIKGFSELREPKSVLRVYSKEVFRILKSTFQVCLSGNKVFIIDLKYSSRVIHPES